MGVSERERQKELAEIIEAYCNIKRGGIFTPKTRERLLGKREKTGRGRRKTDFWYDVREDVKNGLVDLRLFLLSTEEKDIALAMPNDLMNMLIHDLLYTPYPFKPRPDLRTAFLANMLIQAGFRYLYEIRMHDTTLSHKRTINEALDLANYMVESLLPQEQRQYYPYGALP